jgi:2-isopropylmalate synthase
MFKQGWKIPYLHLDPSDVGRQYEKLIRINSQSGKGGVVYVLEHEFGIYPPKPMHPEIGSEIQRHADEKGGEINSKELLDIFEKKFVNVREPLSLRKFYIVHPEKSGPDTVTVKILMDTGKGPVEVKGTGNGPISAAVHALRTVPGVPEFKLEDFREQTLGVDADATALAYVGVRRISDNILVYGAGEHTNIDQAAIMALFSALNRAVLNK